jgi:hypothetical protein
MDAVDDSLEGVTLQNVHLSDAEHGVLLEFCETRLESPWITHSVDKFEVRCVRKQRDGH